jgi:hypothetical protein
MTIFFFKISLFLVAYLNYIGRLLAKFCLTKTFINIKCMVVNIFLCSYLQKLTFIFSLFAIRVCNTTLSFSFGLLLRKAVTYNVHYEWLNRLFCQFSFSLSISLSFISHQHSIHSLSLSLSLSLYVVMFSITLTLTHLKKAFFVCSYFRLHVAVVLKLHTFLYERKRERERERNVTHFDFESVKVLYHRQRT